MFLLISVHPVIQFDVLLIFCHIQTASLDDTKPSTVFDYNTGEKKKAYPVKVFLKLQLLAET